MRRKVNPHQVALLVQAFNATPTLRLWHGRSAHFHSIAGTEQRIFHLLLLHLEQLSIASKVIYKGSSLAICPEIAFARNAQAVKTAA